MFPSPMGCFKNLPAAPIWRHRCANFRVVHYPPDRERGGSFLTMTPRRRMAARRPAQRMENDSGLRRRVSVPRSHASKNRSARLLWSYRSPGLELKPFRPG